MSFALKPPPPPGPVTPVFHVLPTGKVVHCVYDPAADGASNGFRYAGPVARFDHHIPNDRRGIMYAEEDFGGSLSRAFGNRPVGYALQRRYSVLVLKRPVALLDLRHPSAQHAGTDSRISTAPYITTAQEWSRYFYADPKLDALDGLVYSLYNGRTAYAFYHRFFADEFGYLESDYALSDDEIRADCTFWVQHLHLEIQFSVLQDPDRLE